MHARRIFTAVGAIALCGALAAPAFAGSHLWKVNEIFSNPDGTIQFVELYQPTSSCCETVLSGKFVRSVATGQQYDFPGNLTGDTAFRSLLLATAGFAALTGAPAPDYIIPDGFLSTGADTIEYYFYDATTFPAPPLPLDGIQSLHIDPVTGAKTVGTNSPTNYAGTTGSVDATPAPQAPSNLVYSDPAPTYVVGIAIAPNTPSWSGGNPDGFSVDPALPDGLAIDPATGWIEGTPNVGIASTDFTVTASNGLGSATAVLSIAVDDTPPSPTFRRGDVSQDGQVGIGDAIQLLGYLFQSQPTTCTAALDSNDDGAADLGDAIHLLAYLFSGGNEPPPPFGTCGLDPTAGGSLTCGSHAACP